MVRHALRALALTTTYFSVGITLYAVIIAAFYPSIGRNASYQSLLKALPAGMLHAFGVSDFGTFPGFMGGEFLGIVWPIIAAAFAVTVGSAVVAQEVERGTVEFWLSVPVARWRLLSSKLAALILASTILTLATVGGVALGARLVSAAQSPAHLAVLALQMLAFIVAVAGYSALFSTLGDTRGRAAAGAAALTLAFYLAFVLSGMGSAWSWLQRVTIFTAYTPQDALAHGQGNGLGALLLFLGGTLCALAALVVFQHRDIAP